MSFIKKWLSIPSGEVTVEALELYEVRWTSRNGEYSSSIKPEAEVFPSKEGAEQFAAVIVNAFKLLRHTGAGTTVKMSKRE